MIRGYLWQNTFIDLTDGCPLEYHLQTLNIPKRKCQLGVTNTPLQNLYQTCNPRRVTYGISRQYQTKP